MRGEQQAILRYPPLAGHPLCDRQTPIVTSGTSSAAILIPGGAGECWLTFKPSQDTLIIFGSASVRAADANDIILFGGQTEDVYVPQGFTHFRVIQDTAAGVLKWWRSAP